MQASFSYNKYIDILGKHILHNSISDLVAENETLRSEVDLVQLLDGLLPHTEWQYSTDSWTLSKFLSLILRLNNM